jgi:hypothetical protein
MSYIAWALIGMAGYSFTTLLVKLSTRSGQLSAFVVLAIASAVVVASTVAITLVRGDWHRVGAGSFLDPAAGWRSPPGSPSPWP